MSSNRLLARLTKDTFQRIQPDLQPVSLPFKQVLHEPHEDVDYVYFPTIGSVSVLTIMEAGEAIEVASVGREGALGIIAMLGATKSPHKAIVNIEGNALRIESKRLRAAATEDGKLQTILMRYCAAFYEQVSYSVACNGLHSIPKRCCRWLLMTHDRAESDEFKLTHEFLSIMLGVRRATVTETLQLLREHGLIDYARSSVTILDRKGLEAAVCECYRRSKDEYKRILG